MIIPKTYNEIGLFSVCKEFNSYFNIDERQFEELFNALNKDKRCRVTAERQNNNWQLLNIMGSDGNARELSVYPFKQKLQDYDSVTLSGSGISYNYSEEYYERQRIERERYLAQLAREAAEAARRSSWSDVRGSSGGGGGG
ncbi:MAG: hypothetical protein IKP86_11625, partial [Anaerolineaceae bacterium]|nr:hypothetical protein [Anaerolineaceae bacterium]